VLSTHPKANAQNSQLTIDPIGGLPARGLATAVTLGTSNAASRYETAIPITGATPLSGDNKASKLDRLPLSANLAWSRRSFTPRNTPGIAPGHIEGRNEAMPVACCEVEMTGYRRPSPSERREDIEHSPVTSTARIEYASGAIIDGNRIS
jgi:hypothetical protein